MLAAAAGAAEVVENESCAICQLHKLIVGSFALQTVKAYRGELYLVIILPEIAVFDF